MNRPAHPAVMGDDPGSASGAEAADATPAAGATTAVPVDGLNSPENVARFFAFLVLDTNDDEFGEKDWDIRDEAHHGRWA